MVTPDCTFKDNTTGKICAFTTITQQIGHHRRIGGALAVKKKEPSSSRSARAHRPIPRPNTRHIFLQAPTTVIIAMRELQPFSGTFIRWRLVELLRLLFSCRRASRCNGEHRLGSPASAIARLALSGSHGQRKSARSSLPEVAWGLILGAGEVAVVPQCLGRKRMRSRSLGRKWHRDDANNRIVDKTARRPGPLLLGAITSGKYYGVRPSA